nr:hypothetical protein [Tanacetum cinerariifolium]
MSHAALKLARKILRLSTELEELKKEKEELDTKLIGFLTSSKDLNNLIGSQKSNKNKEDDTITDYTRPSPSVESNPDSLQNNSSYVYNIGESTGSILSKPVVKFVKAADCTEVKTNKVKAARKLTVRYAEIYRRTSKSPNGRACPKNNYKSMPPRAVVHKTVRPTMRTTRPNMNDAQPKRTSVYKPAHSCLSRPVQRKSTVRTQSQVLRVSTVCCCCSRQVNTARPKAVINRRNWVNDIKASACWVWKPVKPNSASIILKKYDYVDGRIVRNKMLYLIPTASDEDSTVSEKSFPLLELFCHCQCKRVPTASEEVFPLLRKTVIVIMMYKDSLSYKRSPLVIVEGAISEWFIKECIGSITTWDNMVKKFVLKFHHLFDHDKEEESDEDDNLNISFLSRRARLMEKLKDETLALKAKVKGSWGDAAPGVMKFYIWLKNNFENFHELDYDILVKQQECWWKVNAHEIALFNRMENFRRGPYENIKTEKTHDPYLDVNRIFSKNYEASNVSETQENQGHKEHKDNPTRGPSNCKIKRFKMMMYSFNDDKEYITIKESEYLNHSKDNLDAYRELLHLIDEGWVVTTPNITNEVNTTYEVSTANTQVSPTSTQVSTSSTQLSTANINYGTLYAFLSSQPNMSQLVHEDLEQIHKDDLEEIDLKWHDEVPTNMELLPKQWWLLMELVLTEVIMAFSDSKFNKSEFSLATYKRGLATVEEQLIFYKKNEVIFYEQLVVLKRDISYKDSEISMLKSKLKNLKQEKESNQLKIENFDNVSKSLDKLMESQILDKSRKGVGFVWYNVVPPSHTGLFSPLKLHLSNSGLKEFQRPEFEGYGPKTSNSVSEDISNEVKESLDAPLVKELVLDDKLKKKTVFPIVGKIEFVRPKQQEKPGHPQKEDQDYVDSGCSSHMTVNMSNLCDFKEFDGGYVTFGGGSKGGKITGKGTLKTAKLDFEDVYFVMELQFNLLSISQMCTNFNDCVGTEESIGAGHVSKETGSSKDYILMPLWKDGSLFDSSLKNAINDEPQPSSDARKKDDEGVSKESEINDQKRPNNSTLDVNTARLSINTSSTNVNTEVDMSNISITYLVPSTPNTRIHKDHSLDHVIGDVQYVVQTRRMTNTTNEQRFIRKPKKVIQELKDPSWIEAMQEEFMQFKLQQVWTLVDLPYGKRSIGTKSIYRNKNDERGIVVRNKERLVAQGYTQEEGIDYDKEVYVCQTLGFEDPEFPDKLYKVEKALYGLHQAPRAWSTRKEMYTEFEKMMHKKFQMSSIMMIGMGWKYSLDEIRVYNVAYLEKLAKNADFAEIVDFLNANPISNETQIRAKVDDKTIVITKSSVRSDLQFNDKNDDTIHEQRVDRVERATITAASLDAEQDNSTINRTQSTAIPNEPIPQGTVLGGSPRFQDIILGDRPAQTRFERLYKQSYEPPLSRVNTLRSGEYSMQLIKLMVLCTKLFARVLALENNKITQDLEITHLKKRVKRSMHPTREGMTKMKEFHLFRMQRLKG